jgi:hemerythrin
MSNSEIDAEHQHFIKLVNELNGAFVDRLDKAEVERIMNLILDDAIAHFAHEERLFVERGFPGAQKHKLIHAFLLNKFSQAMREFQRTEYSRVWIDTGLTIKNLLLRHILDVDTQYIEYLRTN